MNFCQAFCCWFLGKVFDKLAEQNRFLYPKSHGSANIPKLIPWESCGHGQKIHPKIGGCFWGPNLRAVFCLLLGFYREGVGAKLAKKKKEYPHLSIGNTSSYIFIHGIHAWHSCFILPGSYARFTRVYMTCIPLKCGGLFLYFPLDPKTPRHPQFGYIGQYPAFRLGVWSAPYDTFWLDTYTSLVN